MKRNRYPGRCCVCGDAVPADGGYVTDDGVKHQRCLRGRRHTRAENMTAMLERQQREAEATGAWKAQRELRLAALLSFVVMLVSPRR